MGLRSAGAAAGFSKAGEEVLCSLKVAQGLWTLAPHFKDSAADGQALCEGRMGCAAFAVVLVGYAQVVQAKGQVPESHAIVAPCLQYAALDAYAFGKGSSHRGSIPVRAPSRAYMI